MVGPVSPYVFYDLAAVAATVGLGHSAGTMLRYAGLDVASGPAFLLGMGALSLVSSAILAVGTTPTPVPVALEALASNPTMGPVAWAVGSIGALALVRQGLRLWRRFNVAMIYIGLPLLLWPMCMLPPWAIDEGLYHLSLPLHDVVRGQSHAIIGHGNSGFFALWENLLVWPLWLGSVAAARTMQLLVAVIGGVCIYQGVPKRAQATMSAAWLLALMPAAAVWQLTTSYADVAETTYVCVGSILLGVALTRPLDAMRLHETKRRHELWAACFMFGCAASTKSFNLGLLPVVVLLIGCAAKNYARFSLSRRTVVFSCVALLLPVMPFVARNVWRYCSPLPILLPTFCDRPRFSFLLEQQSVLAQFLAMHGPDDGHHAYVGAQAVWHLPHALAWQASFGSTRFDAVLGPFAAYFMVVMLPLSVASIVLRKNSWVCTPLALAFVMRCIIWLSISWQARFLICAHGAACLLAAYWVHPMLTVRRLRGLALVVAFSIAALHAAFWPMVLSAMPSWDERAVGDWRSRQALRQALEPGSKLCDQLHALAPHAIVYLAWAQRLLPYCLGDVIADSYDEGARLRQALATNGEDLGAIDDSLRRLNVTHVLVHQSAFISTLDIGQRLHWQMYVHKGLDLLATDGAYALFSRVQLRSESHQKAGTRLKKTAG